MVAYRQSEEAVQGIRMLSFHKQNKFYWAINKDAVDSVVAAKFPAKLHLWAEVSSHGVIGPYLSHQNG